MSMFFNYYKNDIVPLLIEEFNYKSIMQVPKIKKITLNMGVGDSCSDKNLLDKALIDLTIISGQKPLITKAHKSIASFKLRKNYPIGCKVTLRNKRMWYFFEKLICIAIPRIRDFRGFSIKSFDKNGNFNIGIREQLIFPEIKYNKIDKIRGMDININTTAKNINEGYKLLKLFNFPFKE